MSLAVGVASNSTGMGFDKQGNEIPETHHAVKWATDEESGDEEARHGRRRSESSLVLTEDEDEDRKIELGPQCTLKEQLEKDKVGSLYLFSTLIEVCSLLPLCSFVWFC